MVKLSPKALRFAESTAEQVASIQGFHPDQQRVWQDWSRQTADTHQPAQSRPQGGYIELTNPVASLFLHAIDTALGSVDQQSVADEDPDLGNDIEFLQAIKASLESELATIVRG